MRRRYVAVRGEGVGALAALVAVGFEAGRIAGGEGGGFVRQRQVQDAVADGPALGWSWHRPLRFCEWGDDGIQRGVLGSKVITQSLVLVWHRGVV